MSDNKNQQNHRSFRPSFIKSKPLPGEETKQWWQFKKMSHSEYFSDGIGLIVLGFLISLVIRYIGTILIIIGVVALVIGFIKFIKKSI